jgi:Outer membrane protein beta-barrel domain
MRKAGFLLAVSLLLATVASAQEAYSKAEVFLGYQYEHVTYDSFGVGGYNTNGFAGQFVYYPTSWVGIVGDVGVGWAHSINGASASGQLRTYMAGPRVGLEHGPLHVYGQFLIGDGQLSSGLWNVYNSYVSAPVSSSGVPSYNGWAYSLGGGIDARVAHHLYVKLAEADFLGTHFNDPFGTRFRQNNFEYRAGFVFRF